MKTNQPFRTSYSALQTFKQCPQKYKFQAIDKIRAPKSKEAVFGSKIHKVLQYFHSTQPVSPTLDEFLNHFKDNWDSTPFRDGQEDMIYFSEAIKILKNYYNNYLKTKNEFTVLNTEVRFQIMLGQKCLLTGIIDRIDKTKNGIEIIDYKTAKKLPSQKIIDNNLQLSLYCLGLMGHWPQFAKENIKLTFYYLKHQETLSTKRTEEQLNNVKEQVWQILTEIEKSDFKPIPSILCDWCGYKKICPMWKHKFTKKVDDEDIQKVIKEFLEIKESNQKNNKKLAELKEIINNYLDQEKIERVFGESGHITRLIQARYNYDMDKIKKALGPLDKWKTKKEFTVLKSTLKKQKSN